jgi:ferredoxin
MSRRVSVPATATAEPVRMQAFSPEAKEVYGEGPHDTTLVRTDATPRVVQVETKGEYFRNRTNETKPIFPFRGPCRAGCQCDTCAFELREGLRGPHKPATSYQKALAWDVAAGIIELWCDAPPRPETSDPAVRRHMHDSVAPSLRRRAEIIRGGMRDMEKPR